MKTLPANASDEDILPLMQEWVNLLAEEKYDEAYHYFVNEEHNIWNWSPQNLKHAMQTYGGYNSDREISMVTPWEEAEGEERARRDINWRDNSRSEGYRGYIWLDLPLCGVWSDLTAILTLEVVNDRLVIELESIRVM